jgi:ribonuclease HII
VKSRKIIAGVDEVGRGSLVGSVFSAAVIFRPSIYIDNLVDSKKLSPKNRIKLSNAIVINSLSISIGVATKDEIDEINIHHATLLSMKRAVDNLSIIPDKIYFDGLYVPDLNIESHAIVKGDSKIREISAASIIAKVARDNEMTHLNNTFRNYEFIKNKGYGTPRHLQAISFFGKTIYHRESFLKSK